MAVIQAQGTTFTFNDGTTAQTVDGIVSYSGFDGESTEIDVTTLASTAKEFDVGLEDFGNLSLELIFNPDDVGQAAIAAAKTAAATRECVLTLPSGTLDTATFNAIVKSFSKSGGVDDVVKATVNLRITGAVAWS
jgi:hypothetical protein